MVLTGLVVKFLEFCKWARQYQYSLLSEQRFKDFHHHKTGLLWLMSQVTGFCPLIFFSHVWCSAQENLNKIGRTVIVLHKPCVSTVKVVGNIKLVFLALSEAHSRSNSPEMINEGHTYILSDNTILVHTGHFQQEAPAQNVEWQSVCPFAISFQCQKSQTWRVREMLVEIRHNDWYMEGNVVALRFNDAGITSEEKGYSCFSHQKPMKNIAMFHWINHNAF